MLEYGGNQDQIAALSIQIEILMELLLESNPISKEELNERVAAKVGQSLMLDQEKTSILELAKF